MNPTGNLFNLEFKEITQFSEPLSIMTPLGYVKLEITLGQLKISETPLKKAGEISDRALIYIWDLGDTHLELVKLSIQPLIPAHMQVDHCAAFLVRFKCLEKIQPQFSCYLTFKNLPIEEEPESGQYLVAESFQDREYRLTIGTEDEESLLSRAKNQKGLPSRFVKEELLSYEMFDYLKNGIKVSLPLFQKGEEGQLQFVISWAKVKGNDLSSTFFAVDISPDILLRTLS